jgi:hypothetical protein
MTFDGTLISGMSFETLASEDLSATRLTATSAAKRTIPRLTKLITSNTSALCVQLWQLPALVLCGLGVFLLLMAIAAFRGLVHRNKSPNREHQT